MRVLTFVKIVQLIPLFFVEISKEVEQKMIYARNIICMLCNSTRAWSSVRLNPLK